MGLDLFTPQTLPSGVTGGSLTVSGAPDWFKTLNKGIVKQAVDQFNRPFTPYAEPRVADFTPDQVAAQNLVRQNQGIWAPGMNTAGATIGQIAGSTQPGTNLAMTNAGAATGFANSGAGNWTDPGVISKYMNPFTSGVVDEIARLGNRNFRENILPEIDSSFVGSGQFGSSRNATILGNAMRDTQRDITGQQTNALMLGYKDANTMFNSDMARDLQAGQLAVQAGQLGNQSAAISADALAKQGQMQQGIAQNTASLAANDAAGLSAIGAQQQQLDQANLDSAYEQFLREQGWGWNQLSNLNSVVSGSNVPGASTTGTLNVGNTKAGPTGLDAVAQLYGVGKSVLSKP